MSGNIAFVSSGDGQVLDTLQVERVRGITVKAQTVSLFYKHPDDDQPYLLNLIDTPGHVDFSYEVSRSLAATQGVLLLVDASQGIQAQTLANFYTALENNLDVVPILSKMDLKGAEPEAATEQMVDALAVDADDVIKISSKTGMGLMDIFPAIVKHVKPPGGDPNAPFRALLFDSW